MLNTVDRPPGRDPIDGFVGALAERLHGPTQVKDRMVGEVHDGLVDAVSAYTRAGLAYEQAACRAVAEFGTADELAPVFQRELTIAQTRHTARTVAVTVPALLVCWYLVGTLAPAMTLPSPVRLIVVHLAGAAGVVALVAVAALATTGMLARWVPVPRRLPPLMAWTSTAAGAALALVAVVLVVLVMAVGAPPIVTWPLVAVTAAGHGVVAASARACRRCARLPQPAGS